MGLIKQSVRLETSPPPQLGAMLLPREYLFKLQSQSSADILPLL